jgi:hypothetical protein
MKLSRADIGLLDGLDRALAFDRAVERALPHSPALSSPDITCEKIMLGNGTGAYVYRHRALGEVGTIRIEERGGRIRISGLVAGRIEDPLHEERNAVFESLMRESARAAGMRCIQGKHHTCDRCGAIAASLIFINGYEPFHFEECARAMHEDYSRRPAPVWIIGPQLGDGPEPERAADILQVWPKRAPMKRLRPAEFNAMLERIVARHCAPPAKPMARKRAGTKSSRSAPGNRV